MDQIRPATLQWSENGQPLSTLYNDLYFSREGGLRETEHVFLHNNHLPGRWQSIEQGGVGWPETFVIAETGFGTGLNFLTALCLFLKEAPPSMRMEFFSCELHPMRGDDLQRSLSLFPELAELSDELNRQYGHLVPGPSRYLFASGRVALNLYLGNVVDFLKYLQHPADAWFLDGFAPSRNEQMWSDEVLSRIGKHSKRGSTFATFTAASSVRRGLEVAGFRVEKVPGFGSKREMLRGTFHSSEEERPLLYARSGKKEVSSDPLFTDAIVIGAGIAGTSVSASLSMRGYRVALIERENEISTKGSGNIAGVIFPFLNAIPTPMSRYLIQGFLFTLRRIAMIQAAGLSVQAGEGGVLQLGHDERQTKRFASALRSLGYPESIVHAVSSEEASRLFGYPVERGGVYFPAGLHVHPASISHANLKLAPGSLELLCNTNITTIRTAKRMHSHEPIYEAIDHAGHVIKMAPHIVVAAGVDSTSFVTGIDVRNTRGQVAWVPSDARSESLGSVLCYDGYLIPAVKGIHILGASYEKNRSDEELDCSINDSLMEMLQRQAPGLLTKADLSKGRVGFRCMGADHLPIVGSLHKLAALQNQSSSEYRNFYVATGFGSRGMSYAPLAGEIIAGLIAGEPTFLEEDILNAIAPERFLFRAMKRAGKAT